MSLTCAKSKKERLVGISLQQGGHAASHSFVALVDELLPEVAVDLLGRQTVVGRQGAVDEVRQLRGREREREKEKRRMVKIESRTT